MTVFKILANNLKALRAEKNITQQAVADNLQISRANLGRYETGENVPPLDVIIKMASFYDVTTDFLLGLEDEHGNKIKP